jgi:hypothetical protein
VKIVLKLGDLTVYNNSCWTAQVTSTFISLTTGQTTGNPYIKILPHPPKGERNTFHTDQAMPFWGMKKRGKFLREKKREDKWSKKNEK